MQPSLTTSARDNEPFRSERRVRWGECDPAGVVYTPRFTDFVVEAFHDFLEWLLEGPLQERLVELDLGTPAKAISLVFHKSLWPDDSFTMAVYVRDIRTRSFELDLCATSPRGERIFDATFAAVCILHGERRGRSIPDALRRRLEAYRSAFAPRRPHESTQQTEIPSAGDHA